MLCLNDNFDKLPDNYLFFEIDKRAKASKRKDLINLGVGDATLPLTKNVLKSYVKSAKDMGGKKTFKGYSPDLGYDFFKSAIKNKFEKLGVSLSLDEIFINDGAKSDIFNVLTLFKGVTSLIHDPVYPAYLDTNMIFGNRLRFIDSNLFNGFLPLPNEIPEDIRGKSLLIYICSPDNPTGAVYDKKGLKEWVDYSKKTESMIIFDSAYEGFVRGDYPKSIFQIEGAEDIAVEISSLSKSANFTGVRCGFTIVKKQLNVGSTNFNKRFARLKSSSANGVSFVAQSAGATALSKKGAEESLITTDYYLRNANILKEFFNKKSIYAVGGENSPYVFFKCPKNYKSFDFFELLLNKTGVVTTPGIGFGKNGEGFMRLSGFSTYENTLEAVKRLDNVFDELYFHS